MGLNKIDSQNKIFFENNLQLSLQNKAKELYLCMSNENRKIMNILVTNPVKKTTKIPVGLLLNYREFDRVAKPAPQLPFVKQHTVKEHMDYIKEGNKIEPIELGVVDNMAVVFEGNHRTAAFYLLYGEDCMVEVEISYFDDIESADLTWHAKEMLKTIDIKLKKYLK